jgi:TPR repeat protein
VKYAHGRGVEKDEAEAVVWYRKAAEQGDAAAQCNLGVKYAHGRGVEKDEAEAVVWYRKAAEQGDAAAQCNLGVMYGNGRGVEKDEVEAVEWYRKAAEQGYASAQNNLGVMYEYGQGVEKDEAEAVVWYRKAAEQGNARAQYNLGWMYENRIAVEWYRKAAKQGDVEAQRKIDWLQKKGCAQEHINNEDWIEGTENALTPVSIDISKVKRFVPSGSMYHIVSVDNLASILQYGILSKNIVNQRRIKIDDISDKTIQNNRRENKAVFDGHTLHDYASFYMNPRNAMLYRVCKERGGKSIVIIEVGIDVLKYRRFAFSNMNAAVTSDKGQFFARTVSDMECFDWKKINADTWFSTDEEGEEIKDEDTMRRMQAEVLVLDGVPTSFIKSIHCINANVAKNASTIVRASLRNDVKVCLSPDKFF